MVGGGRAGLTDMVDMSGQGAARMWERGSRNSGRKRT